MAHAVPIAANSNTLTDRQKVLKRQPATGCTPTEDIEKSIRVYSQPNHKCMLLCLPQHLKRLYSSVCLVISLPLLKIALNKISLTARAGTFWPASDFKLEMSRVPPSTAGCKQSTYDNAQRPADLLLKDARSINIRDEDA
eukprot:6173791-Pleurochrysis_carterae.AAC.4